MGDRFDASARSRIMSAIRSKNTQPELFVRSSLHRAGLRFRVHVRELPGAPDIVLPRHRVVVEVRGCFWHSHPRCTNARIPRTRTRYWRKKLRATVARDLANIKALRSLGWRIFILWECKLTPARLRRTVQEIRAQRN